MIIFTPWLIYLVGDVLALGIESVSKQPLVNCEYVKSDMGGLQHPCGFSPSARDALIAILCELLVSIVESCVNSCRQDDSIPVISSVLHFCGLTPFCFTSYSSALYTSSYLHRKTNPIKWIAHYYVRFGLGIAAIFMSACIRSSFRYLSGHKIRFHRTRSILKEAGQLLKQRIGHFSHAGSRSCNHFNKSTMNMGYGIRRYTHALCCFGRAHFVDETGELTIENSKRKKEKIPPGDIENISLATADLTLEVLSVQSVVAHDPGSQHPSTTYPYFFHGALRLFTSCCRCRGAVVTANLTS